MTATCPNGHTSVADDYCDVCGVPIDSASHRAADTSRDPGCARRRRDVPGRATGSGDAAGGPGLPGLLDGQHRRRVVL